MNVGDTKQICSRCGLEKERTDFIRNRNICKSCINTSRRLQYRDYNTENIPDKSCTNCNIIKPISDFIRRRHLCKDCNNIIRRTKYKDNEEYRKKLIQTATIFKQNKILERQRDKEERIGVNNKECRICKEIKSVDSFRHNRMKCKDCIRDLPFDKLKRVIRYRIWNSLKQNKDHNTIFYLGCDSNTYFKWILSYDESYTIENRGREWHIDHVIPLSRFDLNNENEQLVAFNWRNTMPLSVKENLSKNNRIIKPQIEQHYQHLLKYHKDNKIEMPSQFIDLFAKHLDAGNPLEPMLSNK